MTSIRCSKCDATLLVKKRYANCPWCTAPLDAAYIERAERKPPKPAPWLSAAEALVVGAVAAAGLVLVTLADGWSAPPHRADRGPVQVVTTSLSICQQRLARQTRSGRIEYPPRVANKGSGAEFFYEWPDGSFHFEQADGLPVPMRATCRGRIASGRLIELTLNGVDLLQLRPLGD